MGMRVMKGKKCQGAPAQLLTAHYSNRLTIGGNRLARVHEWLRTRRETDVEPRTQKYFYQRVEPRTQKCFYQQVAVIIGKTYAECGDGATLTDDLALMLIRDLLLELDAGIIHRYKKARLRMHL